jgi:hypothetical protein
MHSHDAAAGPLVLIQSKMLPLHFSREFLCDSSAATLAAIACAHPFPPHHPSPLILTCAAAAPFNFVRNIQLGTPAGHARRGKHDTTIARAAGSLLSRNLIQLQAKCRSSSQRFCPSYTAKLCSRYASHKYFAREIPIRAMSLMHVQRTMWLRLNYTQDRLRVGWGSLRVGLGNTAE